MKRRILGWILIGMLLLAGASIGWAQDRHRLGLGAHYWTVVSDLDEAESIDESGIGYVLSYQYMATRWIKLETDFEMVPDGYSGSEDFSWAPQALFILGEGLYGGVGVGIYNTGGDWADQPFFSLRAGVNFEVLPSLFLDVNANYRFEEWDIEAIKDDVSTDTMTLGAMFRFSF